MPFHKGKTIFEYSYWKWSYGFFENVHVAYHGIPLMSIGPLFNEF